MNGHATRWLSAALPALALVGTLRAQDDPATRSLAARDAYRRAALAQRNGLADSAYADVVRAQAAWPEQPAYAEQLARMAARRGDADRVALALDRLIGQGTGAGVPRDTALRRLAATSAALTGRLLALEDALAPVDAGRERIVSADTTFWPEGIDADPRDGTLFVTSLRHRNVLVVEPSGRTRWLLDRAERPAAVMGVAVDPARGVLWLATTGHHAMDGYSPADTAVSELLRVRDGVIERRWRLGDGRAIPGELAVAPDGEVVVSDATAGRLHRLMPGADTLEILRHPLLRSAQGIAFSADGARAWIADWSHGLLRWDRRTGAISAVSVAGSATLVGIDGLRRVDDRLIGVQNGVAPARVIAISLSADGERATGVEVLDRPDHYPGEPTIGAMTDGGFVYVASSHWPFWGDDQRRVSAAPLPAVRLRTIRLAR